MYMYITHTLLCSPTSHDSGAENSNDVPTPPARRPNTSSPNKSERVLIEYMCVKTVFMRGM